MAPPKAIVAKHKNRGSRKVSRPRGHSPDSPTTGCTRTCRLKITVARTIPALGGNKIPRHRVSSSSDGKKNADATLTTDGRRASCQRMKSVLIATNPHKLVEDAVIRKVVTHSLGNVVNAERNREKTIAVVIIL